MSSQSIDFRINDFINEYLDYKGFNETVGIFVKERQTRHEPIQQLLNGKHIENKDDENNQLIQTAMLKYLDEGNREEFFRLWSENIPSTVIDSDPSLKSLEFLLYAHFSIYYLRPNISHKVKHDFDFYFLLFYSFRKSECTTCQRKYASI